MKRLGIIGAVLAAGLCVAYLGALPICNLVYDCGCGPIWGAGVETCRYMPGMAGVVHPCPWCDLSQPAFYLVQGGSVLVGGLAAFAFARRRLLTAVVIGAGFTGLALVVEAWIQGLVLGYPRGLPGLLL
jgi:hypothetical protein